MNNYVDLARTTSKYTMIFTILGEMVGVLSIIVGIMLATRGMLSVGEFATFTSYCFTINGCIVRVVGQIGKHSERRGVRQAFLRVCGQTPACGCARKPRTSARKTDNRHEKKKRLHEIRRGGRQAEKT